jgi:hypothetical protein
VLSTPHAETTPNAAMKARDAPRVPRRFDNPVEVPTAVFDGLETVQESRETSMLDHQAV